MSGRANRLGSGNVVTLEIDAAVAAQARTSLRTVGLHPEVIRANGELAGGGTRRTTG
ncbi:hypothetical protein ACEZCY_27030 [Streptacidiphilus sp. N1-12]|uniref:Uncharacterized protein n=2 Tax=Streptacidiphilus alkalitolerans TaxID=3342712 RepID=A0ABV6WLC8_9ACTN